MSALTELYDQIAQCKLCDISRHRTKAVPGEGPENAQIMFIGEAPGFNEDQQGRPFVGAAGQFLDKLLASIGLSRNTVYITNIIKTRPPENRDPLPLEIENCKRFLDCQLELLKPKIIVTLGRHSMARFFPGKIISKIHGTAQKRDGVIYFAMYHPAAALHQGGLRKELEADMVKLKVFIDEIEKPAPVLEKTKQLNLFEV